MAIEFKDPINMNQLEVQNMQLQNLGSDPATPVEGQIWHRSDLHRPKVNDGTVNQELAYLTDAQLVYDAEKDPTGFENSQNITVTYNGTNRTVTLTTTDAQLVYWFSGRKKLLGTNTWTSSAHANTAGNWYLYSTDGTNFAWSNTVWEYYHVQVVGVRYASATKYIAMRETHGLAGWEFHRTTHLGIGTQRNSSTPTGGTINGFVTGSTATADRRPGATVVDLLDEDLATTVNALTDGGPYSHLQLASSTTTDYVLNTELEIAHMSGTTAQYQSPTTAAWSNIGNNNYANVYLVAIPATADTIGQYGRWLWFQPQATYANLATAKSETFVSLNRADLLNTFAEFLPVARVTIKAVASYFSIEAIEQIYGSRAGASGVPAAAATTASAISFAPVGGIAATDVQSALQELDTEKANLASPTFTGTVSGITKNMVGLGNVDNTSDVNKPVSTATQTALNGKQNIDVNLTSIAALSDTGTGLVRFTTGTASLDANTYLTTNQTITLSGIVTGSGTTAITTAIADNTLSIAKTSGLQTALNGKQGLDANLTAIAALSDTATGLVRFTSGTASLDANTYLTSVPAHSDATASVVGIATAGLFGHVRASGTTPLVAGTAAIGTDNGYFAREAHVHPAQTTVSGNAGTATKLAAAVGINGVAFDGSGPITITAVPVDSGFYVQGNNATRSDSSTNLDTIVTSGFTTAQPGATGLPAPGFHHLITTKYQGDLGNNWTFQLAAGFGVSATGAPPEGYYVRIQESTTWKPWRKLYHDGEAIISTFDATLPSITFGNHPTLTLTSSSPGPDFYSININGGIRPVTTAREFLGDSTHTWKRADIDTIYTERCELINYTANTTYSAFYGVDVTPNAYNFGALIHRSGQVNYLNGTTSAILSHGGSGTALVNRVVADATGVKLYGGPANTQSLGIEVSNSSTAIYSGANLLASFGGNTIAFFGGIGAARQTFASLMTNQAVGTITTTIPDWSSTTFSQATARNITRSLGDRIAKIEAALRAYSLI